MDDVPFPKAFLDDKKKNLEEKSSDVLVPGAH